ncbi:MAG: O-antigen ligase family protein [Alteromonadaceae bacterium]|nr:O-antigen ligase family protein [Alteromonadaceae bacterium]
MSKFALLFLMVFFGGIVAALVYSGTAAFVLYQLVYFLNPDARWWSAVIPGLRYSMIASLLMLLVLFLKYRQHSELAPWSKMPVFKYLIALVLLYYLAYLFAVNLPAHKTFTFEFTKLAIIILVAYKLIHSPRALDACLWAYVVGATYIGYLAWGTGRNDEGRVEGIGMVDAPDANDTAAALVPAAVILMYYAWMGSWKMRALALFCGALIANGLVLINSRGSFLGVVVSLSIFLFFMLFSRYQRKGQRAAAVLMMVVGLSGALYVTDDLFWQRMQTLQSEDQNVSGASRMSFWFVTFDMLDDHPMGVGITGYQTLSPIYMDEQTRGGPGLRAVHSSWFQGLAELGWIGLGVFLLMLLSLYRLSAKAKRHVLDTDDIEAYFKLLALECALLGYLAAGTFIDRFRAEILYWMILFLAAAINIYYLQYQAKRT